MLDLLPSAVSAVYFVYHSDFEKWQLGKVSVMREALLTSEEGYGWYYMGYYIPTCRKMRYKGEYKPQEVLRPADNVFVPLEGEVKRALDEEGKLGQEEGKAGQEVKDGQEEENDTEIKGLDGNADDDKSGEDGEVEELDGTADEDESEDEGGLLGPGFLFKSQMPGVMAQKELDAFDLGEVKIRVGRKDAVAKVCLDPRKGRDGC